MVHRSVDLVNTQITRLFRSHPDLLSEFALFLPERKLKTDASGAVISSGRHAIRKGAGNKDAKALDPSGSPSYIHEDKGRRDLQLFERIKKRLGGNPLSTVSSPTQYNDFLKCVHLFTQDVLSRDDLVEVLQDLLGTHRELFADFKLFLGVRDDDTKAHMPMCVSDLDLSKAIQAGTSYKKLPDDFCPPPASNCTTLYASLQLLPRFFPPLFPASRFEQLPGGAEHTLGECCHGKRRLQLQALPQEPVRCIPPAHRAVADA
jgi:histone deacetylase complex regulatory component SIN3